MVKSEEHRHLALLVVKQNRSVEILRRYGLEYSQIASLIDDLISGGYLELGEERVKLTELGESSILSFKKWKLSLGMHQWVHPDDSFRCKRMDINMVFLPKKRKPNI